VNFITRPISLLSLVPSLLLILMMGIHSHAQGQGGRAKMDPNRFLQITYANEDFNKDPRKIDSATVFMRDAKTGKVVKISMEETAPDASVFRGLFNVSWGNANAIVPQVYIIPPSMEKSVGNISQFRSHLKSKTIRRKPLVFKKNPDGIQILDVYDSKKDAVAAAKEYKKRLLELRQQQIAANKVNGPSLSKAVNSGPKLPSRDAVEAARKAERLAALAKAAKEAAKREEERLRKEKLEAKKREEALAKAKAMAASEKRARKAEAKRLAEKALALYRANQFNEAEKLFEQATQLDPENNEYFFQYGVTLFRNNKLEEAMIKFKLAETTGNQDLEKQYFMGLTHYKLNEWDQAVVRFSTVKDSKVKPLSPSAAFYLGLIQYNKEEYRVAQPEFEFVLDNSSDPKLDEKAEEYIEKIIRHLQFEKLQEQPHSLSATIGLTQDSNVLLSPDNTDSGSSTDEASLRYLVGADYTYRAIYKRSYDLSFNVSTYYMYSQNEDVADADPLIYSAGIPFSYKTSFGTKAYILKVTPGYEAISLNGEATQNSTLLEIGNTLVMGPRLISTYDFVVRMDDTVLDTSTGDDDADATRIEFETNQIYYLDKKKTKSITGTLGYWNNAAKGENKAYNRFDLGVSYAMPIVSWQSNFVSELSYYSSTYESDRKDTNMNLNLTLSRPFTKLITGTLNATYTKNDSNDDDNTYTQWTILASATFAWTF